MQTVSAAFTARAQAAMRKISFAVLISFAKNFDADIDFFTIGTSTIGGTDILKGDGSVLQEWDQYDYTDYSERVLAVEVNREAELPTTPITLATADIVMDNHDDIFTPGNENSPLAGLLVARRPVRISLGFSGENIPKFVGLTIGKPAIDEKAKTATFHCQDFLKSIMNISLDEEVMYQDMRTDEIISALLQSAGLTTSQFDLDTGGIIIPFAYFKKGSKLGDALHDVAEAELGNIYMAENGQIRFEARQNWIDKSSSYTYTKENVLERHSISTDTVINVVEVYSRAREVQAKQSLWQNGSAIAIKAGETIEVFADFKDDYGDLPVTSVDDPDPITAATTSLYSANTDTDGSGDDITAFIDLDATSLFSTAFKMTFTNSGSTDGYITSLELFGTPAKVINDIYERVVDSASVGVKDGYEEHPHEIKNDLIQDKTAAHTIGQMIIEDRAEDDDQQKLIVKSVPQQQVGDLVTYDDENATETYFVTRVNDILNGSGYRQVLQLSKRTIEVYFRIGISTIGGTDAIGP